jgi:hypothetical protein
VEDSRELVLRLLAHHVPVLCGKGIDAGKVQGTTIAALCTEECVPVVGDFVDTTYLCSTVGTTELSLP